MHVDVVVVGAGTAGANAAYQLARRGRTVALVERRRFDGGGAQWINGLLDRHFDQAGVARPVGAERVGAGFPMHLRTPDDQPGLVVRDNPVVGVDMSRLGRRLRSLALEAGVRAFDRAEGLVVTERAGRVVAVEAVAARPGGTVGPGRFEAPLFVDASGRRGVLRRQATALAPWCPPVRGDELCSAADVVFAVADRDGARRALDRWGAAPGDAVNVVGRDGGFSTRSITVSPGLDEVRVLVGCVADGRWSSAPRMLADVRRDHRWIGDQRHGGTGVIPLRRPYARFTAPGLALVGDAAAQVFPAHGSGVGVGLVAGTVLADAVAAADDPGSTAAGWAYQATYWRRLGGDLAFYDGFRRLNTRIGSAGVGDLIRGGVLSEHLARCGLDQTAATPRPADVPRAAAGLAAAPRTARLVVPALARLPLTGPLAARYPTDPDPVALTRWAARMDRLVGP